jgi:hypothetical protein
MDITRFNGAKRFRVIVGAACFYATANQIRDGVGDFVNCNTAIRKALDALEFQRSGTGAADQCSVGLAGTWEDIAVQLNVA